VSRHLSDQQIVSYHQANLEPAELLAVVDHLGRCATCRERTVSAEQLRSAFDSLSTGLQTAADKDPAHLAPEKMAAYLDEQLDEVDRSIADDHLELCKQCREELIDLRTLNALTGAPSKEPAATAALTKRNGLFRFSRSSIRWLPLPAAALAALLVVGLLVIPSRNQLAELRERLKELQQSNDALQRKDHSLPADRSGESPTLSLKPAPALALIDGAGVITLYKDGQLGGLESAPATYQELVKTVLTAQRVKLPSFLSDLVGKREVLMGRSAGKAFFQILPVGTVVETDRPLFRWSPLIGATSYAVTIFNSATKQAISSSPLSGTEWTPPEPLERGGIYAWEVTATKDGKEFTAPVPPHPQAKFKVLELARVRELNLAKEAHRDSRLIMGILYAQSGLLEEAERELEALIDANPDSLTARKLLTSLKGRRR
jgi:anti-sigma factor RsiW